MKVLIDNGHGEETPGKRSPDGRLREYAYTREIAQRVENELRSRGVDAVRIVPETSDISLQERVRRANRIYEENAKNAILVSIHCNAYGDGSAWMQARGWSVFIDTTASNNSKLLATTIAKVALAQNVKVRRADPKLLYWESSLYICKHTNCPAVLIENFFQDNKEDVEYLLSEEGKQCITDITVEGIIDYLDCSRKITSVGVEFGK